MAHVSQKIWIGENCWGIETAWEENLPERITSWRRSFLRNYFFLWNRFDFVWPWWYQWIWIQWGDNMYVLLSRLFKHVLDELCRNFPQIVKMVKFGYICNNSFYNVINTAKGYTKTLVKYLQEFSICTGAILKPGLRVFSCNCSMEPGHSFMCSGGNELLQLRPLADDCLLQSCPLNTYMI